MKHWTAYPHDFARVTLQAHQGEYRADFQDKEDAHAFVRLAQKFAAAVRRDDAAPPDLKAATAADTGGVLWHLPAPMDGTWAVRGMPRTGKRRTTADIAAKLP